MAFAWSWDVTLVTASLVLWEVGVLAAVVPAIVRGQAEMARAEARGAAVAGEALEGVRLVVACGAQGRVVEGYAGWVRKARERAWRMAPVVGVQFGLVVCVLLSFVSFLSTTHLLFRFFPAAKLT